jgi:hypothetical protein
MKEIGCCRNLICCFVNKEEQIFHQMIFLAHSFWRWLLDLWEVCVWLGVA